MPVDPFGFNYQTPQGFPTPQVDFSWLGNLPETALANQQRQYQLAALRLGMQQSQDLSRMLQDPSFMGGGMGGGGTGTIGRTSSAAPSDTGGVTLASYSPTGDVGDRLFHAVYGNESNWGADTRTSNRGASGPMQITQGTFNANALPGESIRNPDDNMRVGRRILDKYLKQYGDPQRAMVAYFSGEGNVAPPGAPTPWKRNSNDGHWTVAQYVANGMAKMRGFAGSNYAPTDQQAQAYRSDQLNPKDKAAVDAMYGKPADQPTNIALNATGKGYGDGTSTARPAPDENVARETPGGLPSGPPFAPNIAATSPTSSTGPASSKNATGPAGVSLAAYSPTRGGAQPPGPASAVIPSSAAEAAGNQGAAAGTVPPPQGFGGRPAAPITPAGTDNLAQPAAATTQPQRLAQAGAPGRQPLPRIEDNPDIRQLDNAITGLQQRHAIVSGMTFAPNRDATLKVIEQRIEDFQKQRDARYNTLKEQYAKQQETEEKAIAGREQTQRELGAKVQEAQIKRSDDLTAGINSTARDYETELEPYIKLGRSILNQPGMYTGFGGERSLDFNKVRAAFGDRTAAQLQETFKKVRGQVILGTIANQRTQMQAAGEKSARLFARTADTIEEAIPGLETSPAGILSLMEIQARLGEQSKRIRDMAASYKAEQIRNGRLPVLDDEFDARVSRSLEKDPAFTDYDLAHPQTLGAPTAPAGLNSKEDYTNWGRSVGLRPGDPFRTRNGKVVPLP